MSCLFLDLASHSGLLACVSPKEGAASIEADHRIGDHELTNLLENLLKDAGWSLKDLTQIACVVGPGGFTSLRVAVAAANALAWSLKVPVSGIHLSDLYAARSNEKTIWVHSTKKVELFVREPSDTEARLISIDELPKILGPQTKWMGELIPEHQKIAHGAGASEATLKSLTDVLPGFVASLDFSSNQLVPWYGRGW